MLRKSLIIFGWGTIIVTIIYELRQLLDVINTVTGLDLGQSTNIDNSIKDSILWILLGFFQGIAIGLLCLFAADRMYSFGKVK